MFQKVFVVNHFQIDGVLYILTVKVVKLIFMLYLARDPLETPSKDPRASPHRDAQTLFTERTLSGHL